MTTEFKDNRQLQRAAVLLGIINSTRHGVTADDLTISKATGRIVSKRRSALAKKRFKEDADFRSTFLANRRTFDGQQSPQELWMPEAKS
jgi:hypothetical protein